MEVLLHLFPTLTLDEYAGHNLHKRYVTYFCGKVKSHAYLSARHDVVWGVEVLLDLFPTLALDEYAGHNLHKRYVTYFCGKVKSRTGRLLIRMSRIFETPLVAQETAVAQCLRCCATKRKVAGSIPDSVTGIFH